MYKMCTKLSVLRTVILLAPMSLISARLTNTSMPSRRSTDGFSGATDMWNRQYPIDATFLVPHLIVGILIPIAVIIGVGVLLMKLFIIGFMLLGRGGFGMTQNLGGYYPWRAGDQQHQIQRSLLNKEGSLIPSYLSDTIWQIITKLSNSIEKYQKYKN